MFGNFRMSFDKFDPETYAPDDTLVKIPWYDALSGLTPAPRDAAETIVNNFFAGGVAPRHHVERFVSMMAAAAPIMKGYRDELGTMNEYIPRKQQSIMETTQSQRVALLQESIVATFERVKEWARGWRSALDAATVPRDRTSPAEHTYFEARRAEALAAILRRPDEHDRETFLRESAERRNPWPIYAAIDAVEPVLPRERLEAIRADAAYLLSPKLEAAVRSTRDVIHFGWRLGSAIYQTLTYLAPDGLRFRRVNVSPAEDEVDRVYLDAGSGTAEQWLGIDYDLDSK